MAQTSCSSSSFSSCCFSTKLYRSTRRGWGESGCLLGCHGSAATCIRKRGHKLLSGLEIYLSPSSRIFFWQKVLYKQLTMWYSNVLIELFQTEFFRLSQRSDKYMDKFLLPLKFFQKLLTLTNCNFSKLIR